MSKNNYDWIWDDAESGVDIVMRDAVKGKIAGDRISNDLLMLAEVAMENYISSLHSELLIYRSHVIDQCIDYSERYGMPELEEQAHVFKHALADYISKKSSRTFSQQMKKAAGNIRL